MLREHREHCGRYIKLPVVLHLGPLSGATLCSSREKNRPANTAIVREHAACALDLLPPRGTKKL